MEKLNKLFEQNTFTKEFAPVPILRLLIEPAELMLRLVGYRPYNGLYHGWKLKKFVRKETNNKRIEDLRIPFAAIVTDVVSGKSHRITQGDLGVALTASTAVPVLRKPVQIGDRLYCDGGVINNLPVDHAKEMGADFVIAVDIDEHLKERPLKDFRALGSMGKQAIRIQLARFDEPSGKSADFYIHPNTTDISLVSFKKKDGKRGIEAGIKSAREAMPELKRKLAELGLNLEGSKNN